VTPKLLDFGLVREAATSSGATRPGTLLGTPRYMSPEQAWGRDDIDPRSDLWSLGIVLYECLSGVSPFEGTNDRAVLASIVAKDAPHLRTTGVAVDDDLADAVMLALTRAPEARIPSAAAWEAALARVPSLATSAWHAALFADRALAHEPSPEATETSPDTARRPRTLALSALALVAMAILSWALLRGAPAASRDEPADTSTTDHLDSRPVEPARPDHPPTAAETTSDEHHPTTAALPPSAQITASEPTGERGPMRSAESERATGTLTPPQTTGQRAGTGSTDRRPSEPPSSAEEGDSTPRAPHTRPTTGPNAAPLVDDL
jgi:serine/threonine protein kinase